MTSKQMRWMVAGVVACGMGLGIVLAQLGNGGPAGAEPTKSAPQAAETKAETKTADSKAEGKGAEGKGAEGKGAAPDLAALKAQRQEQRTAAIKAFLEAHNVTDAEVQGAVIEQLQAQEEARRTLQEAGRKLFPVLGRKGMPPASEAQTGEQLEAYEKAVKAYQEKRRQSEAALEEKTKFSKNTRLRAILTVLGLVGDGPAILPL